MRISKITFALLVMLIITGCGKKQELPETLSSETTTIDGNMGEYYEVVEGSDDMPKEDEATAVSSSSNNWDSVLDEYEQYCNKLASLSKKAIAGDMSVMTEYSSALEQAQRLGDKLENAQGEMTPAQVARLNKIAAKMAQSMM
ncbi:MAG: hypothetical protein K2H46_10580 [Muribaculaceae bacterium]|nr:hypothetical protein [Muribaculaceae bacterium]